MTGITPLTQTGSTGGRQPDAADIHRLREAGAQIRECYRVMSKDGVNIVGEVLKGQGTFFEMTHYPLDEILDNDINRIEYTYT